MFVDVPVDVVKMGDDWKRVGVGGGWMVEWLSVVMPDVSFISKKEGARVTAFGEDVDKNGRSLLEVLECGGDTFETDELTTENAGKGV